MNIIENKKIISAAVIKRLPKYYRHLGYLLDKDIKKTSSKELATMMNITSSQIRQDLTKFGNFGQQGYGYDVKNLYLVIKKILGIDSIQTMIIIGFGNIGHALANYTNFEKRGFSLLGIFDKDKSLIGTKVRDMNVQSIDNLGKFLSNTPVDIAVLTVPNENANQVARMLEKYNIKGIWNFSNIEINLSEGSNILVENTHLTDSLMTLSYKLNKKK